MARYMINDNLMRALASQGFAPDEVMDFQLRVAANGMTEAVVTLLASPELLVAVGAMGQRELDENEAHKLREQQRRADAMSLTEEQRNRLDELAGKLAQGYTDSVAPRG